MSPLLNQWWQELVGWYQRQAPPIQAALVSGTISIIFGSVIAWITHLRSTRPILVFMRRPNWHWKIRNVGTGTAFNIQFEDKHKDGKYNRYLLYPIGPNDEAPLGDLSYGDEFTLYYSGRSSVWPHYRTVCKGWMNRIRQVLWRPRWKDCTDETRLINRERPNEKKN